MLAIIATSWKSGGSWDCGIDQSVSELNVGVERLGRRLVFDNCFGTMGNNHITFSVFSGVTKETKFNFSLPSSTTRHTTATPFAVVTRFHVSLATWQRILEPKHKVRW